MPRDATQTLSPAGRGRDGAERRPGEGVGPHTIPTNALLPLARRLRRDQTDPERLLWSRLRARRLEAWKFRRQMPIGRFIVDFCCPDAWLIVELDGGQHSEDVIAARDAARTQCLETHGYLVLRFWNREVTDNLEGVCATILNALRGCR